MKSSQEARSGRKATPSSETFHLQQQDTAVAKIERPCYPIIYVRGYAMTQDEIVQTTSTPFMSFEAGSTKIRQAHDGRIMKFVFESPLVRLMKDYGYLDNYASGAELPVDERDEQFQPHEHGQVPESGEGQGQQP